MAEYAPLNIKPETKERLMKHKDHKNDTQDDVVNQVLDEIEGKDTKDENSEILEKLDRIEAMTQEATHAAQRVDTQLEAVLEAHE